MTPGASVVDLAYTDSGRGPDAGAPVVLLHAFPLSAALFGPLVARLTAHRVITPDLRGFGGSPLGTDEPSLGRMADDVRALLDRLAVDRAVVGGVSMGGYVTMELMRAAPDRLAGVVLVDTKAGADAEPARQGRIEMAQAVLRSGRPVLEPMLDGLLGATTRSTRPDVVARVSGWLDAADPHAVAWGQRAMAARPSSFDTLAFAGVPGAVIVGEEDTLSPPDEAAAMADRLGTTPRTVPGAGHLAVVEQPDLTAAALVDALDELGTADR